MKKTVQRILALVMVLSLCSIFACPAFADSVDVVPEGYTGIYTVEDLWMIRNDLTGKYILMNDLDLTQATAADGEWSDNGKGWQPIGLTPSGCNNFSGEFDGNDHVIQGMRINVTSINTGYTDSYYSGLFAKSSGTIKNVKLTAVNVNNSINRVNYFGAVCAYNTGTVENCSVNGTVTLSTYSNSTNSANIALSWGTIAGYNAKAVNGCASEVTYTCSLEIFISLNENICIGGMVGKNDTGGSVSNCINRSAIKITHKSINRNGTGSTNYSYSSVGGIVGYNMNVIDHCVNLSDFISNLTAFYYYESNRYYFHNTLQYLGGIAGYNAKSITCCYNSGSFAATAYSTTYNCCYLNLGGITGKTAGGTVTSVYNCGAVTISGNYHERNIGGIAGSSDHDVYGYYSNANFSVGIGSGSDVCTPLTSTMMTKQGCFPLFDFTNDWVFYPCSEYKYPQLRALPQDNSSDSHVCKNYFDVLEPTCTAAGYKKGICESCGVAFTQVLPALGHSFSEEFTVDIDPSCFTPGSKSKHCTNCDAIIDETEIPAIGEHTWGEWQITSPVFCSKDGERTRECLVCHETETDTIPATGHAWDADYTIDTPATCIIDGSKSIHCKFCTEVKDETVIPATGHTWGEWDTVTAATCTVDGTKTRECSVCSETETDTIPATGHAWDADYTIDTPATCIIDGSKSIHCKNCDAVKNITVIPATGHKWGEWETVTAATYTSAGESRRECSVCHEFETKILSKLEKIVVSISIASAPQKTEYQYRSSGKVDKTGLSIIVNYSDNTTETISNTSKIDCSDIDTSSEGTKTVTVKYGDQETSFDVKVTLVWWQWIIKIILFGFLWY